MKKILVAGATGYVGGHIISELKRQQYFVRAIARKPEKLTEIKLSIDEVIKAEITQPQTLVNCCRGIDTVITSVGITRQKDGLTYMDVDYQANLNLLNEAIKSGVRRFIYIFIFNAAEIQHLKIIQAKQKFTDALRDSGLDYCLINPTGFFSDMGDFLKMAERNKVFLFGNGNCRINPIAGKDLAEVCVKAIHNNDKEINIGGPKIFTYTEIAEVAFHVLNKPVRIKYIPVWAVKIILFLLQVLTSSRFYGPLEFMMTVLTMDMVAPEFGSRTLKHYFEESLSLPKTVAK